MDGWIETDGWIEVECWFEIESSSMGGAGQEIILKSSIPADSLKFESNPAREASNSNFKLPETR